MVANPRRRTHVTDAALTLLGSEGGRALTHRAVDRAAGVPTGTCANYFPTRPDLLLAMAQRIFERLTPEEGRLATLAEVPVADAPAEYVGYVVERLLADPDLARALVELRLAASRSPEIFEVLAPVLRDGLDADVTFHESRGLAGGRELVLLLHHLVNGLVLDTVTVPLDPDRAPVTVATEATRRLTGPDQSR
ncbi:hypothetical protein GCM10009624_10240 [Gordonia sinesedis]